MLPARCLPSSLEGAADGADFFAWVLDDYRSQAFSCELAMISQSVLLLHRVLVRLSQLSPFSLSVEYLSRSGFHLVLAEEPPLERVRGW